MIKNVPAYANDYKYIVARYVEGDYWFYGAWDDATEANNVALEVNGEVFEN